MFDVWTRFLSENSMLLTKYSPSVGRVEIPSFATPLWISEPSDRNTHDEASLPSGSLLKLHVASATPIAQSPVIKNWNNYFTNFRFLINHIKSHINQLTVCDWYKSFLPYNFLFPTKRTMSKPLPLEYLTTWLRNFLLCLPSQLFQFYYHLAFDYLFLSNMSTTLSLHHLLYQLSIRLVFFS